MMFKRFFIGAILPAFLFIWGVYNLALMMNGPDGRYVASQYKEKRIELAAAEKELDQDYIQQQHRLKLLSRESLDLDLLDENARDALKYARPDEIVITMDELDRLIAARKQTEAKTTKPH